MYQVGHVTDAHFCHISSSNPVPFIVFHNLDKNRPASEIRTSKCQNISKSASALSDYLIND